VYGVSGCDAISGNRVQTIAGFDVSLGSVGLINMADLRKAVGAIGKLGAVSASLDAAAIPNTSLEGGAMTMKHKTGALSGAIAAIAMMAAQISPATALTLYSPAGADKAASPQVEKVWWCRWGCRAGWGWRGGHWGYWGAGAVAAGVVAGAAVGAAAASAPYYGGCWRRVVGPYGGVTWARVC
jgi:hypothetical protein